MDSSTELQHTLELAFHRAPVGLCVSRHRTIEICNEAFAQMFGYAQADLMGHSLARLYPSLDEFAHIGKLGLPVMQTTGTYSDERIMCRSDGALFWCHVAGRALDRADPFAHAVWMFEDISQRRPVGAALTIREREIAQHISHALPDDHRLSVFQIQTSTISTILVDWQKRCDFPIQW